MSLEFTIDKSRTDGMSPADIKNAVLSGKLKLCTRPAFSDVDPDRILSGLLQRGGFPEANSPACLDILALGHAAEPFGHGQDGMPLALIQRTGPGTSKIETASICTYCDSYGAGCLPGHGFEFYAVLQDDPAWNADAAPDDD